MGHESSELAKARRGIFAGRVARNVGICTEHYRLTLEVARFPESLPGQFVQLECCNPETARTEGRYVPGGELEVASPAVRELGQPEGCTPNVEDGAYLRRPFSIAGRGVGENGRAWIDVIHRVVGRGTRYLAGLEVGDEVSVLGPLGKGFWLPKDMDEALLVGGGVGIPPMLYLAEMLGKAGKRAVAFVGAQRRDLVPLTFPAGVEEPSAGVSPVLNAEEFARHGIKTVLTTDDGSWGMKGYVTGALDKYLAARKGAGTVVFCCGPTPMMKATAKVAAAHGVRCLVSLEQPMACGMGTCQSCVVKVKTGNGAEDWVYKLTCTDGPVFDTVLLKGF